MNFTKVLKKIALYFGAFIGLLSLTAGLKVGVFFINKPVSVGPNDSVEGEISPENESLSKVLDSMLTTDKANFDLNLVLESEASSPISVSSDIFLSMPTVSTLALEEESQDESLKISLKGDVQFNNQTIPYEINYLNGFIYANLGDVQIKIKTENFMGDLNTILDFAFLKKFGVNIALPDLSQFEIGPEMISMLASQLTETETETGKQIKFNILGLGWVVLQTDVDYVLQNISLEGFEFSGTKLTADVKANLSPLPQEIVEPENKNDMTDLTGLTNFLKVVDELITKGRVGGNAIFKIMDKQLTSQYNIDFSDFNNLKAYLKTKFVNNDFELVLHNNDVYITYADCKYCFTSPFDFTEIAEALEFYAQKFGFEIPQNEFSSILEVVDVSDLNQLLKTISNLKVDATGLKYSYQDLIFNLSVLNGEFDKITASFKDIVSLDIDLNSEVEIPQINESDYKNLLDEKLFSLLHKQLIVNKNLSLQAEIEFGDITIEASLKVDFKNETKVQLQANVFDRNILLTILDTKVYLEVDNILKASGTFEQLLAFVKSLNLVELTDNNIELTEILQAVLDFLDNENVVLTLLKENGVVNAFEVIEPNVHCVIEAVEFEEISYTENGEYIDLVDLIDFGKGMYEQISSSPLAFDVNVTYGEYTITGKVQYISNEFSAKFSTTILNKNLSVEIENTTIYVNFDGLKFKCEFADLEEIFTYIAPKLNLDLSSMENIDINDIISKLQIGMSEGLLKVDFEDVKLTLSANPVQAEINYNELEATLTLSEKFDLTEKVGYLDFAHLKQLLKATINSIENKAVGGQVDLTFKLFEQEENISVQYALEVNENNDILAHISTRFKGIDLNAFLINEDIYVEIFNIKVHYNLSEIPNLIQWLNTVFKTNISANIDDYISVNTLKNMSFDIISALSSTENSTSITLKNGYNIVVEFDETIQKITISSDTISANILCSSFDQFTFDTFNPSEYPSSNLLENKQFALKLTTELFNEQIIANLQVDLLENIKIQLTTTLFKQNVQITILGENVYVEIGSLLRTKTTLSEFVGYIKNLNLEAVNNFDISQIEQLFSLIENNQLKIEKVENVVKVTYQDYNVNIESINFTPISYTENGEYIDLVDLIDFGKGMYEQISSSPLAFDVNVTYGEYAITGKVQYISNEFSAKFSTTILNKNLSVEIENTTIYVNFDGLKFKCSMDSIKDLVEFIQTNTTLISGDLSLDINLDDVLNNIELGFSNETLIATYQNINIELSNPLLVSFNMDSVKGTITLGNQFDLTEKVGYFDFDQMQNLFKATINTLKNMSISGEVEVTLNLFGEDNILNIDYAVALKDNKLIGYISTTFKGLNIVAYIDDKDVYIDVVGLKVHINIDNISEIITWINQTFNTNIEFDLNSVISQEKLESVHLDIIQSIATTSNSATIGLNNDLTIGLSFDDYIRKVEFANENKLATLTCTDFNLINLDNLNRQEFKEFDDFKTLINNIYSLAMSKQYDLSASVQKYVDNALTNTYSASVQMDITSSLNAYFDLVGLGEQITINYENKNLYFCYGGEKGLKLSIQESAIQEILAIVCSALKIDTSSIPFLDEFLQKENIDTGNLNTIMPEIDFGNPLQYLEYIEVFDITDSYFAVTLRAEKLGEFAHGKDVSIKIYYSENSLSYIEINNLYITSSANEFINVTIDVNTFANITSVAEKEKYIDISGAKDLLRAFVNTSNLTDWHIKGKVQLDISLGSLSMSAAQLDVDIQVKLVNNKPVIAVEVSNYPLIGLVNNSNTNGIGMVGFAERYRTISVYYQDGELYLKTTDAKYGAYKQLIRTTKITPNYLVQNLSYYTQYLLGFTDTIQTKIDEAIEKSLSYTGETDYGNIILEYTQVDRSHTIKLNLTELAHNPDIGTLSLTLTTLNNDTTNNLDYLYRIDLDLNMLDNLIILKTDQKSESQGLYLTNIGEAVDISKVDEIKQLYKDNNFVLDGEYEKEGDKAWEKANTGSSKITFISEGKEVKVVEGEIASNITFPTMSNFILEDDVIWQEFEFVGWFYDEQFTTKFEQTTMPRYDTVLYAKWQVVKTKYFATISFETNQEHISLDSITGFIGDNFTLPVCNNFDNKQDENTTILYTFVGWFTAQGEQYISQQFDQANLTLYAHWTTKTTVVHSVQVVNNGVVVLNNKFEKGTKLDLSSLDCFNSSTLVYSSQIFEDDTLVQDLTINSDITLYLRNKFKVTIKSDIATLNGEPYLSEQELYEGSTILLPQYSFFVKDMGSYTIENTFLGYTSNGQLITENTAVTPNGDCVFEASWNSIEYCIVTFEIVWSRPSGWVKDGTQNSISQYVSNTNNTNQVKIQRNTELVFENYVAEANYEYKIMGIARDYDFKTVAWAVESENVNAGSYKGASSMTITSNCTLKPIWKGIY